MPQYPAKKSLVIRVTSRIYPSGSVNGMYPVYLLSLSKRQHNFKANFQSNGQGGFRACLVSGPPGIGKTTATSVVSKELGFEVIELNASDARNKASLDVRLNWVFFGVHILGIDQRADWEPLGHRVLQTR